MTRTHEYYSGDRQGWIRTWCGRQGYFSPRNPTGEYTTVEGGIIDVAIEQKKVTCKACARNRTAHERGLR